METDTAPVESETSVPAGLCYGCGSETHQRRLREDNVQGSEVKTLSQHRSNEFTKHYLIQNSFAVELSLVSLINIGQHLRRICRKDP